MRVVSAIQASETCRAVAASFGIAPSAAGKRSRVFSRSGFAGRARSGGHLRPALEFDEEWIREQVRARPGKRSGAPSAKHSTTSNRRSVRTASVMPDKARTRPDRL